MNKIIHKSLLSLFILCVSLTQLSGCNKNNDILQPYGKDAYAYVEYLQDKLPSRIAGSKNEQLTGDYIQDELKKMGYTDESIQIQEFTAKNGLTSRNIIVTKKGSTDEQIIVSAHYDSVHTHGVDDNGSGVAVALESAKRILDLDTKYTIQFGFWGAEETGIEGSGHYAKSMTQEEKDRTKFVINIDSVLAGDKQYVYGGAVDEKSGKVIGTEPLEVVKKLADKLNIDMNLNPGKHSEYPSPTTGDWSDHVSFKNIGIPYVYFEATNWYLEPYDGFLQTEQLSTVMHTESDNLDVLNKTFPQRAKDRLRDYTKLMHEILIYQGEY